jgi:hypothetical protein
MTYYDDFKKLLVGDIRKHSGICMLLKNIKNNNVIITDNDYHKFILQLLKYKKNSLLIQEDYRLLVPYFSMKTPTCEQLDLIIESIKFTRYSSNNNLHYALDYLKNNNYNFSRSNIVNMSNIYYVKHFVNILNNNENTSKEFLLDMIKIMNSQQCELATTISEYIKRNNILCNNTFLDELMNVFRCDECKFKYNKSCEAFLVAVWYAFKCEAFELKSAVLIFKHAARPSKM